MQLLLTAGEFPTRANAGKYAKDPKNNKKKRLNRGWSIGLRMNKAPKRTEGTEINGDMRPHHFNWKTNLSLTEREGRTGEYWSEVVAVRTEHSEVRIKTAENQYFPITSRASEVSKLFVIWHRFYERLDTSPVVFHKRTLNSNLFYVILNLYCYDEKTLCFAQLKFPGGEKKYGNGPFPPW